MTRSTTPITADYSLRRAHSPTPSQGSSRPASRSSSGTARVREVPDCPTGRRGLAPHLPRRARPAARPRGPARDPLARCGRPYPLGAARVPAPGRCDGALAREPRRAALRGPDGPGRPLPARARPALRGVRAPRRGRPHRLREPRRRPGRRAPDADPAGFALRASGGARRRRRLVRLGSRARHRPGGAVLHPDAPRAPARLRPPVGGEGVPLSPHLGVRLPRRAPPRRPRPRRRAGRGGGDGRPGRGGRVPRVPQRVARAPAPARGLRRPRARAGAGERERPDCALRRALPPGRRRELPAVVAYAKRLRRELGSFLIGSCTRRDPALQHTEAYIRWQAHRNP